MRKRLGNAIAGTAIVELIPWAGKTYDQPLVTQHVNYTVAALGSMVIKTIALKPLLKNASLALSEAVVRIQARSEGNAQGIFQFFTKQTICSS